MNFGELTKKLFDVRIANLGHPWLGKFYKNSRNCWQADIVRKGIISSPGKTRVKSITLSYADQNPNGKSWEAEMVRKGIWKAPSVGWLWTFIDGKRVWLGNISPKHKNGRSLANGYVDKINKTIHIKL